MEQQYIIRIRRRKRPDLFFNSDSRLFTVIKSEEATTMTYDQAEGALKDLTARSYYLCANGAARIIPIEEANQPDPPAIRFHIAYRRIPASEMDLLQREIEGRFRQKYPNATVGSSHSGMAIPDYVIVTNVIYPESKEMETILSDIMNEAIAERMEFQHA